MIQDHPIRATDIHSNVMYVCRRLHEHGHTALVVGGAVRDLLLGRSPKDFDLATSARPEAVKQLFRNARIIGRRFRLAQLRFPNMSVEVATFRGEPRNQRAGIIQRDNRYGTSEEDARRRDFTINALTFDPLTLTLYDYVGGLDDLRRGRIRTIKPPEQSYREDPVRMLRAVRFQVRLGFRIAAECEAAIPRMASLLHEVTRHRLADEMQRFLTAGHAEPTYREFARLGLLEPLLHLKPYAWLFAREALDDSLDRMLPVLRRLDEWAAGSGETPAPTVALLALLVTLGSEGFRASLRGEDSRAAADFQRAQWPRLAQTLGEWGLLNGQVHPALAIMETVRALGPRAQPQLAGGSAAQLTGIREAVLLRALLRDALALEDEDVRATLEWLPRLPDLPILDHPRPLQRASSARADRPEGVARRRSRRGGRRHRGHAHSHG